MPHAELKFSSDLELDAAAILAQIEQTILTHDDGSGACKGRAYPTDIYHHTHVLVTISMLTKAHRDADFTRALLNDLETAIKAHIAQPCYFSLALDYTTDRYVTNEHRPEPG